MKAILTALLVSVVFIGGMVAGVLAYRHYLKKYYNAIASKVLYNLAEEKGYVTFLDSQYVLHCVSQKIFDGLMNNILEAYPTDREM